MFIGSPFTPIASTRLQKNFVLPLLGLVLALNLMTLPLKGDPLAVWVSVVPGVPFSGSAYQGGISIHYEGVEPQFEHGTDPPGIYSGIAKDRFAIEAVTLFLPQGIILDTTPAEPGIYPADFVLTRSIGLSADWANTFTLPVESEHDGGQSVTFDFPVNVLLAGSETTENSHFGEEDTVWITFDTDRADAPVGSENYISYAIVYPSDLEGCNVQVTVQDRETGMSYSAFATYTAFLNEWEEEYFLWETNFVDGEGNALAYDSIPVLIPVDQIENHLRIEEVDGTVLEDNTFENLGSIETAVTRTFFLHNTGQASIYIGSIRRRFVDGWMPWDVESGSTRVSDVLSISGDSDYTLKPGQKSEITIQVNPVSDYFKAVFEIEHASSPLKPFTIEFWANGVWDQFDPEVSDWYPFTGEWTSLGNGWGVSEYSGVTNWVAFPYLRYSKELGWVSPNNKSYIEFNHSTQTWIYTEHLEYSGYYYDLTNEIWKPIGN
jgi:hypothetical protein